jgi:two-component system sensor histidine kinase DesK
MLNPRSRRDVLLSIAVLASLALVISLDNTAEWATMFIYTGAACAFRLASPEFQRGVAAATVATAAVSFGLGYPTDDAVTYVLYSVAIGAMLRGYAHLVAVNRELHQARDEIGRLAVSEERSRFARDLHDLLGHSLSVIALKSELARRLLPGDPARASAEVRDIEQVTRDALVEVREAVGGYRRMSLASELRGAEAALHAAGIEPEISQPAVSFAPDVESVLAWAVREGTTNVIRHSRARHCTIHVHGSLSDAGIEIVDDGTSGPQADGGAGSGLAGLTERVRRRHGRLEAGHDPGGGFRLVVELPALP